MSELKLSQLLPGTRICYSWGTSDELNLIDTEELLNTHELLFDKDITFYKTKKVYEEWDDIDLIGLFEEQFSLVELCDYDWDIKVWNSIKDTKEYKNFVNKINEAYKENCWYQKDEKIINDLLANSM